MLTFHKTPPIKRFKISDTDPLAIVDLGWSMEFIEDDTGFRIAPPHAICRADTPKEAERTLGLLNAVAPLAETVESVKSFAYWARVDLEAELLREGGCVKQAIQKLALWAYPYLNADRRRAKNRLTEAETAANTTLDELKAVIRGAK